LQTYIVDAEHYCGIPDFSDVRIMNMCIVTAMPTVCNNMYVSRLSNIIMDVANPAHNHNKVMIFNLTDSPRFSR